MSTNDNRNAVSGVVSLEDIERHGLTKMTPDAAAYIQAGHGQNLTVFENRQAFDRWRFLPRVLAGVSDRKTGLRLLGKTVSMPVGISPAAALKVVHPDGEIGVARAARRAGTVMVVSVLSSTTLEEVAAAAGPDAVLWAQLDICKDRSLTVQDALRAQRCGCAAIVVTLDPPSLVAEEAGEDLKFLSKPTAEMFESITGRTAAHKWDESRRWEDVDMLRRATDLPLVLKGILRADDAIEAVNHGASAIIVSNHGGRRMDGVAATLDALPDVVRAVAGRCEVYLDGGVRSGTDVVKALCLGARAVFIGRPALYGLGYKGESGVMEVLEGIRRELDKCLALLGCPNVEKLHRGFLVRNEHIQCDSCRQIIR